MSFKKIHLSLLLFSTFLISCTSDHSKIVVAEYGNYKIYLDEFEKAYAKNSGGIEKAKTDSLETLKKFLDLYVSYKMKLRDAEIRGFTTDPDMQKELIDYKVNIGSTLFLEDHLYEPALKKMYERRKTEFKAAHIMLIPDSTMNDEETAKLGNQLIERINNGEDYSQLAEKYSKDVYTNKRGGVVGWVTSGMILVPEIEEAIYTTEPGNIYYKPVKSSYGYHIIKVLEKQPRKEQVKVQHIMVSILDSTGVKDSIRALMKILDIEKKLKDGADFNKIALENSEDKMTAKQFGDLGFLSRGRIEPKFEDVVFSLNVNEISPIIETSIGYHIVKVNEIAPFPSFQESAEELKEMFIRTYYKQAYEKLLDSLKVVYNYKANKGIYDKLVTFSHEIKSGRNFETTEYKKSLGPEVLFTLSDQFFTVDSLFSYILRSEQHNNSLLNSETIKDIYNNYVNDTVLKRKAREYDKESSQFASLMEEYEKGIYLFKILEEEVWTKVAVDSAMIQNYFDQHREDYKWKDRVEFKEIYSLSDSLINRCHSLAISGENFDSLAVKYSRRSGYDNVSGYYGLVEIDVNELSKKANSLKNIGNISEPFRFQDGWSIVKLVKRDSARLKNIDEVKAEIASLLQEQESKRLENDYINSLKEIYKPEIYYNELNNAFKNQ
jgi:peptidyl-prolyl cis-trans isomerase SurA